MPTSHKDITVLIADDHPTTRAGIRAILETTPDIRIIGEVENGFQVEKTVAALQPNILLLDLIMPGPKPAQLEKSIRAQFPEIITLVLTAHDRDAYLATMMDMGVAGFLCKTETGETLVAAIRLAASGLSIFTEDQCRRALSWRHLAGEKWKSLTAREREVLHLIMEGRDNKYIAKELGITSKTAAYHVTSILKKLNVKCRHEAIAWVQRYLPDNLD
jgi:DNA-binding NarL/FixJ family response regulator